MSYWKYRAFDALLRIQEGVFVSPTDDDDAPDHVLLQLRQQGLQGVELKKIDRAEYNREVYLQKLKDRGRRKPQNLNPPQSGASPSIRERVARSIRRIFTGRNG